MKSYHQEIANKKLERARKLKVIQNEQLKQIEKKRLLEKEASLKERDQYERFGKTASDKFYINEDERKRRENARR